MNKIEHLCRMGVAYLLRKRVLSYPPYMVSIEATNVCNFRCKFCPQSDPEHKKRRKNGMLSADEFGVFVKKVLETGTSNKNMSITLDGEPSLNKDFPTFIEIASRHGLFPRFSSNGYMLIPELTDRLVGAGAFLASVDFASKAEYFDGARGFDGSFDRVRENILYLVEKARQNQRIKLEIVDISSYNGADKTESLLAMNRLFEINGALPDNVKTWSRVFHNFCGHMDAKTREGYMVCPYPWSQFVVAWNGDVVACCRDTSARTVLGNVFQNSILEIWNGSKYAQFRADLAGKTPEKVAACRGCDMPYSRGSQRWNPLYLASSLLRR